MSANTFGSIFRATTFGESHGQAMGVVVDGCPAGVSWQPEVLKKALARRRPGASDLVSSRNEADAFELLSGVYQDKTLGTPIALVVRNADFRSSDYEKVGYRVGHADDTWENKFSHRDPRGGGRASGRETVSRVMAGAVAEMMLSGAVPEIKVFGFSCQIGEVQFQADIAKLAQEKDPRALLDKYHARLPDQEKSEQVRKLLTDAKEKGESYGGIVTLAVFGVPANLGQPVFHKLKADLTAAMMSVGATAGVGLADAFSDVNTKGSEFHSSMKSMRYGGIRGGISTGEPILLHVAFKPTSSVGEVARQGRHDPCILPRAIPVLEAMAWLVLADHWLWHRLDRV